MLPHLLLDSEILEVLDSCSSIHRGKARVCAGCLALRKLPGGQEALLRNEEKVQWFTDTLVTGFIEFEKHFHHVFEVSISVLGRFESHPVLFVNFCRVEVSPTFPPETIRKSHLEKNILAFWLKM